MYNVVDGVDLYSTGQNGEQKARTKYKLDKPSRTKHQLQVLYIHQGQALVCGTTTGTVRLWEVGSGDTLQELAHGGESIQSSCVAYPYTRPR